MPSPTGWTGPKSTVATKDWLRISGTGRPAAGPFLAMTEQGGRLGASQRRGHFEKEKKILEHVRFYFFKFKCET